MTARKPKSQHKPNGRPTVMTPDIITKLEDAFTNAFTDEMACLYAGISIMSLYRYCEEHPKFSERKEQLKQSPNLLAQKTLVKDLDNTSGARWWAEKRMPEFMPKSKLEHSGLVEVQDKETSEAVREVTDKYEAELKKAIIAGRKKKAV